MNTIVHEIKLVDVPMYASHHKFSLVDVHMQESLVNVGIITS